MPVEGVQQVAASTRDPLFEEGVAALRAGELEQAIEAFQIIANHNPRHALALSNLAIAQMRLERWREAGLTLINYLKLEPEDPLAHVRLGIVQRHLHYGEQAIRSFMDALRWDPKCAQAYCQLGETYLEMGRLKDAKDGFKWALRLHPTSLEAMSRLAEVYHRLGVHSAAAEMLQNALDVAPPAKQGPLWLQLGRLLAEQQMWKPAAEALGRAIESHKNDHQVHYELGVACHQAGFADEALTEGVWLFGRHSPLAEQLRRLIDGEV